MEALVIKIKNWSTYQHYKDRNPPWVKLSTSIFQEYEFSQINDASKLLAICIITLASRYKDPRKGLVPDDIHWIKRQCNLGDMISEHNFQELENIDFIERDSKTLAERKRNAIPEGEGEGEGKKRESRKSVPAQKQKSNNGTRIPENWECSKPLGEWAMNEQGLSYDEVKNEIFKFKDYWTAKSGKDATKKDWDAVFRNWIRNSKEYKK